MSLFTELLMNEISKPAQWTQSTSYYDASDASAYETDDDVVISLDLPGYDKDSISITLDKNTLNIEAECPEENEEDGKTYFFKKAKAKNISKSYKLADSVGDDVSASFDNGVLTVTIKKEEDKKAKRIEIT